MIAVCVEEAYHVPSTGTGFECVAIPGEARATPRPISMCRDKPFLMLGTFSTELGWVGDRKIWHDRNDAREVDGYLNGSKEVGADVQ